MEKRKSERRHVYAGVLPSCILLFFASAGVDGSEMAGQTANDSQTTAATAPNEMAVALKEIPVWEVPQRGRSSFLYGQISPTFAQRDPRIRCPALTSSAPPYGLARFAGAIVRPNGGPDSTDGILPFVLDQSETGAGRYDLLYFDENVDRDLTNDKPRRPLKDVPAGLIAQDGRAVERTWFEPVQVTIRSPRIDRRTIELLPCVWRYEKDSPLVRFVPAKAYTGRFEIDGKSYEAFLGYGSTVSASLNEPSSALHLIAPDGRPVGYLGVEKLSTTQWIDGKYYRFSCTPTGDKLFVHPYAGPLGVLELGAGRREVKELQMTGELSTPDGVVGIGYPLDEKGMPRGTARCEIPVGDYYPRYMSVCLGKTRFTFSNNYYSAAPGQVRTGNHPICGIKISQDKPYVLDFSNKPVVVFRGPASSVLYRPGTPVQIEAVLVDPALDIMIRSLDDMTRAEKRTYKNPDGQEGTYEWAPSLEPKVTIARANGEIVAEGTMPFG